MQYSLILLAAGSGSRTGLDHNKVFHRIHGKMVVEYSLEFFKKQAYCRQIILVCHAADFNFVHNRFHEQVDAIVTGGSTRQNSVLKGLNKALHDYVLVHDAARPFLSEDHLDALLRDVVDTKATTLAIPVSDTIVETSGNRLTKTLNRSELVALQTPQAFDRTLLMKAHQAAHKIGYLATDDTDLIRRFTAVMPSYVLGDPRSMKLTLEADIALLEGLL